MTLGPATFAALVWGAVALVLLVFLYETYAVLREASADGEGRRMCDSRDGP